VDVYISTARYFFKEECIPGFIPCTKESPKAICQTVLNFDAEDVILEPPVDMFDFLLEKPGKTNKNYIMKMYRDFKEETQEDSITFDLLYTTLG